MNNAKNILKNAFIDSQLVGYSVQSHTFSKEFESSMQNIIKYQKGLLKLINTAGKKVACIIFAVLLCLTTVACSIEEVRQPIIKEIQKFFVNAKEILSGTAADEVSHLFPTDVTKIIGTSYISKSQNQYIIDDEETVTQFIELLSKTHWGEPEAFENFGEVNTYWTFDFYNQEEKSLFQIKMCNDTNYVRSKIAVIKDGEESHFYITNKVYKEILAFTNKKFYLHDSKLEKPDKEFFKKLKSKAMVNLDEGQKKEIKTKIRNIHYEIEIFLLKEVSLLKERDSVYWDYVISEEIFLDPIAEFQRKYDINSIMVDELEYIISVTYDSTTKNNIMKALEIWKESIQNHSLEGLFKVHEYLHDYDYYVFNYPTNYVYNEYADYQGLDDYFGMIN